MGGVVVIETHSWAVGDRDGFTPSLLERLRQHRLCGFTASRYGGPDELSLISGGPIDEESRFTCIAGPSTTRFVQIQPSTVLQTPSRSSGSALHGVIDLSGASHPCEWYVQEWNGEVWTDVATSSSSDLAGSLRSLPRPPDLSDEGMGAEEGPMPGAFAGLLTYDLVQWTEPVRLSNLPPEGALNGLLLRCDRWLVHDRQQGTLILRTLGGDEWFSQTRLAVEEWLNSHEDMDSHVECTSFSSSVSDAQHMQVVDDVRAGIHRGEFYQLNYGRVWRGEIQSPWAVFKRLQRSNPAPYSGWLHAPDHHLALVSASPELLLCKRGDGLSTRPIKGTRPRARVRERDDALKRELAASRKEVSEHMMLVDLERNDLSKVCSVGTVRWSDWRVESHPNVHHLVSDVTGRLRGDMDIWDALQALFPGGSITGCPKTATIAAIDEVESGPRRAWTGSLGITDIRGGTSTWNILIRTLEARQRREGDWQAKVQAGGGLVYESNPADEVTEAKWKSHALIEAAGGDSDTGIAIGEMEKSPVPDVNDTTTSLHHRLRSGVNSCISPEEPTHWLPTDPPLRKRQEGETRLLFIDNLDSFSYNIVHCAARAGASVVVVQGRGSDRVEDVGRMLEAVRPTHILLGPGPGRPANTPLTEALASLALSGEILDGEGVHIPLLGVCLGHQALAEAAGWRLSESATGPVHGVPDLLTHTSDSLFDGLEGEMRMMRYHSLAVTKRNDSLKVIATDSETESLVMALTHPSLPVWGVQFHPESAGSVDGERIIDNFLTLSMRYDGQSVEEPMLGREG